jgi:hypothetical protein
LQAIKWSIVCFSVAALATGIVMMTMGWALPRPYSEIGPTAPRLLRSELVRELASRQRPSCLLVVGNSRAAFNVNAGSLSTPACKATNLGFPALGAYEFYDLAKTEARANGDRVASIVLFLADEYLMKGALAFSEPQTRTLQQFVANPKESLVELPFAMRAWINMYRFYTIFESLMGKPLASNIFRRDPELGRWIWPFNEALSLDMRDNRDYLVDAVAREYYSNSTVATPEELVKFLKKMRMLTHKLTVVFPPQYSAFGRSIDKLRPGAQQDLLALLAEVSDNTGV